MCSWNGSGAMLDDQPHFALPLLEAISPERFLGGPRAYLAGLDIELRPVPEALDGPADQHAVGEGTAAVRAAVLKRAVTLAGARQRDAGAVVEPDELHLVHLQLVGLCHHGATRCARVGAADRLLGPFSGAGVAVLDPDKVAVDERAAHPPAHRQ